jgi:redox-sensitive bicupin YhaK (pirin superfamily)
MPEEVPTVGPARVILGAYGGVQSPIEAPPMTYLSVHLKDGEHWVYSPEVDHDVAWVALMNGALQTPALISAGELVLFEDSNAPIEFVSQGETRFVIGSAPRHPHDLVLGHYSVHTSTVSLKQGETEIRRLGRELRAAGKQSSALRHFT